MCTYTCTHAHMYICIGMYVRACIRTYYMYFQLVCYNETASELWPVMAFESALVAMALCLWQSFYIKHQFSVSIWGFP